MQFSKWLLEFEARNEAVRTHFNLGLDAFFAEDISELQRHLWAIEQLPSGENSLECLALAFRAALLQPDIETAHDIAYLMVQLFDDHVEAVLDYAYVLATSGDHQAAKHVLELATPHHSNDQLIYELGRYAALAGDFDTAKQNWSRFSELVRKQAPEYSRFSAAELTTAATNAMSDVIPLSESGLLDLDLDIYDFPPNPNEAKTIEDLADPTAVASIFFDKEAQVFTGLKIYCKNISLNCETLDDVESTLRDFLRNHLGFSDEVSPAKPISRGNC